MTQENYYAIFCRARSLKLNGWELLTPDNIKEYCNGIGAEWMGPALCAFVTRLNPTLRLPAAIHDVRYGLGGTEDDRDKADDEFLANCKIMAKEEYGWYNPIRYHVLWQAKKFYKILQMCGGAAWKYIDTVGDVD